MKNKKTVTLLDSTIEVLDSIDRDNLSYSIDTMASRYEIYQRFIEKISCVALDDTMPDDIKLAVISGIVDVL